MFIAWQSRLLVHPLAQPGIEYYGLVDDVVSPGKLADRQHRLGPVLVGAKNFAPYGNLKYEAGYPVWADPGNPSRHAALALRIRDTVLS